MPRNVQILIEWLIKMRIVINIVYNAVVFLLHIVSKPSLSIHS